MSEPPKTLAEKFAALKAKNGQSPRARDPLPPDQDKLDSEISRAVAAPLKRLIKKASCLADLVTPDDVEKSMQVIRDAKQAVVHEWNGKETIQRPDYKTRLAAVTLERAYAEGLPVARAINVNADFESAEDTLARLKASPEAMKAIVGLREAGVKLAIGEEIIDADAFVHKTGQNLPE